MTKLVKVAVIDLGSFSCKCAAIHRPNCTITTSCIESVVAMVRSSLLDIQ